MNEVLHANIFFIIASIATVVFCILVAIALYQLVKILKSIRRITERIEAASEQVAEDIENVRDFVKSGGAFSRILGFIMRSQFGGGRRKRSRSDEDEE